ncbi:hypothetical protein GCM10011575_07430 [Microlunatus endophyticus]|uniref:Uncharacterized protein n=1 Tax=Microlunatus endophyticus TaxID=1716077 RepID=A0A917S1T8_9ACTN|nr:hypothetical protein [Microlunatus endophyticus]GGL51681.1 hypothetical protein GCM10011575_07430 [Microlunatus endophyticus]
MDGYAPPGWPEVVRPPGAVDWDAQAVAYLLDCCPADFRSYPVLRRHPMVLAVFARHSVRGQRRAAADGVSTVRSDLEQRVEHRVIDEALDAWQSEIARLARVERSVDLLSRALAGERFAPRLGEALVHGAGRAE